uniref:Secreted protein n=1 Tax=Lutzomyia longipalpis TaxID=7200 RepID=A0A1B0CLS4_LUTLO
MIIHIYLEIWVLVCLSQESWKELFLLNLAQWGVPFDLGALLDSPHLGLLGLHFQVVLWDLEVPEVLEFLHHLVPLAIQYLPFHQVVRVHLEFHQDLRVLVAQGVLDHRAFPLVLLHQAILVLLVLQLPLVFLHHL